MSLRKCILSQVDVYIIFECVFSIRKPRGFLQAEIGHKSSFQQFHRLRHTCKEVVVRHEDSLSINLTVSWPATKLVSLHYFFVFLVGVYSLYFKVIEAKQERMSAQLDYWFTLMKDFDCRFASIEGLVGEVVRDVGCAGLEKPHGHGICPTGSNPINIGRECPSKSDISLAKH